MINTGHSLRSQISIMMKQLSALKAACICLIISLAAAAGTQAQQTLIRGTIYDYPSQTIKVSSFFGDKLTPVDSVRTDTAGNFTLVFGAERHPGMYRFIFGRTRFIELIHNLESFSFSTWTSAPEDSLKLENSLENLLYYNFRRFDQSSKIRLELLDHLITNYPEFDSFFISAVMEYESIQNQRDSLLTTMSQKYPGLLTSKIIRMQWIPRLNPLWTGLEKLEYSREHFFDSLSFGDQELMFTNVYTNKLIRYLSMYAHADYSKNQLDSAFTEATRVIMEKTRQDETVYDFIIEYLIGGFEKYELQNTLDFISATYKPLNCENPDYKTALQRKLGNYQNLMVGKTAPDFSVTDMSGNQIKLSDHKSQYTLVLFWASWCPHCTDLLPKIGNWINKVNKSPQMGGFTERLKVIAISLDQDETVWRDALSKGKYNWVNSCDLKGWNSPLAELFNVFATPAMFILDKDRKIVGKPTTWEELESFF